MSGRIIPARAGFTPSRCPCSSPGSDHPRSRGVYSLRNWAGGSPEGSSPLARGLRLAGRLPLRPEGIIPARAGFTAGWRARARRRSDHPRSRGVYVRRSMKTISCIGSSPLARGLPQDHGQRRRQLRIIPARAGFTEPNPSHRPHGADHPRSRGVYSTSEGRSPAEPGSSPLARGLPECGPPGGPKPGIIPARAGFTRPCSCRAGPTADHPRSRGVYKTHDLPHTNSPGSSPLARGLRRARMLGRCSRGIIPARAGFTGVCDGDHAEG